jgi:hypothetical protein
VSAREPAAGPGAPAGREPAVGADAPPPRSPLAARTALALTALSAAGVGVLAAFAPRTFYDDFPFTAHWVDRLPPYNEHLTTDVGALYLGLALVLAWAAWTLQRQLVRAACAGWILFSLLHLAFHARHLDGFGTSDAIEELISLAVVVALPLLALWAARPAISPRRSHEPARRHGASRNGG